MGMGSEGGAFQEQRTQSLARQGSLYNLTLDEVQNQLGDLGKPLGSMNLDELLKSVGTAEEAIDNVGLVQPAPSLQRQASLTLPRGLSKKTVDEVWKGIQQKNNEQDMMAQPTFGEMTLEAFLMKAGVVSESPPTNKTTEHVSGLSVVALAQQNIPQHAQWMHYQLPSVHQQHQQQNIMVQPGFMNMSPASSDTQTPGRKRLAPGDVVEKTGERRQKRMIKNRESAARSRARKQAYTHELEIKIAQLEEENERLRRQQEVEKVLPQAPPPEPKAQLRRTSSF